jgi:hypothetical protein
MRRRRRGQLGSAPEALAMCVAIASISGGELVGMPGHRQVRTQMIGTAHEA